MNHIYVFDSAFIYNGCIINKPKEATQAMRLRISKLTANLITIQLKAVIVDKLPNSAIHIKPEKFVYPPKDVSIYKLEAKIGSRQRHYYMISKNGPEAPKISIGMRCVGRIAQAVQWIFEALAKITPFLNDQSNPDDPSNHPLVRAGESLLPFIYARIPEARFKYFKAETSN